jgi:hypothetical protein
MHPIVENTALLIAPEDIVPLCLFNGVVYLFLLVTSSY